MNTPAPNPSPAMEAALAPCPFCGGTDVSSRPDISEDGPHRVYAYHVFCHDCHAHGRNHYRIGWCESHKAACEAWNDRAPSSDCGPDGVREALAKIDALISGVDRATVNEQNAFEHFRALNRLLLNVRDIARAALRSVQAAGCVPRWRHKKRGTTYTEIGRGKFQAFESCHDMEDVVIYRADADGSLWARPTIEFEDGRFESLPPAVSGDGR